MIVTSNVKGQLAVSKTEMRAFELGFVPSRPLYDCKYDLIVDKGSSLERVQVKYANGKSTNSQGNVIVKLDYEDRTKHHFTYQDSDVDSLVVYIPIIDKLCWIPKPLFVGKRKISIRLKNSKNNQSKKVIKAQDYFW